jgi:hypothetical protein
MDVGVKINQYEIVEHIGRGGMADVWSAQDARLNRMVAIKTMALGLSQQTDPLALFRHEAQTIAQMEHPHILPIYDFGDRQGKLYIVMRYVSGGSLEDLLRQGPLSLEETLRLGQAVAQALDYAHSRDVIHLDLKPANILLDSHKSPYLADFGLATRLNREGKADNPGSGTLIYMAPEQMTSKTIDHRADVYSFCIVMFHMLSGQLPFKGESPLALKQMQQYETLPALEVLNPDVPLAFNEILQRGTMIDPEDRPDTLMEIIGEMRDVIITSSNLEMMALGNFEDFTDEDYDPFAINMQAPEGEGMEILEAVDIYARARHNWSSGNGRFLLGVTHFMLMNGYYVQAEKHDLDLDDEGRQMLLRGALEYDHAVDYWWQQLGNDDRRWVCLHALRSGNAPARVRSMYRLETLPDDDSPQIPKLVAKALQIETDASARLAALQVLSVRAHLLKPDARYDIQTEYRGQMLSTTTRLGLQTLPQVEWEDVVYSKEIDLLIAETALDYAMPEVAEQAARTIGRIYSTEAVRFLVKKQVEGHSGALRALALVRDEARSLPEIVATRGRLYAWTANTYRRLTERPWGLFSRYMFALIGGWLAMGFNILQTYRTGPLFTPQLWTNTLALGLMFGFFLGLLVIFAGEFSARLRGFWTWWAQLIYSVTVGFLLGTLVWAQFHWMYLQRNFGELYWPVIVFGGVGIAAGFVVTSLFKLRSWSAVPLTALLTYLPVLASWRYYLDNWEQNPDMEPLIYYLDNYSEVYSVAIPLALLVALGGHFLSVLDDIRAGLVWLRTRAQREEVEATPAPMAQTDVIETAPTLNSEQVAAQYATMTEKLPGLAPETELDPQAQHQMANTDTVALPKSQQVKIATGIKIKPRPAVDTEIDPQSRRPENDD